MPWPAATLVSAMADQPLVPEGKDLRAFVEYEPAARCTKCGTRVAVRVYDGMPPRGNDDSLLYQEVIIFAVGHCPVCSATAPTGVAN